VYCLKLKGATGWQMRVAGPLARSICDLRLAVAD